MADSTVHEGQLDLEQGPFYWKYDRPSQSQTNVRPTLLFIHAGITDHTLWDVQVRYFVDRGWACLRDEIFGLGKSLPSNDYLSSAVRKRVDHIGLIDQLIDAILPADSAVIPIGLSIGGGLALGYTVFYPHRVAGATILAGGIRGVDIPNTAEEDALFEQVGTLLDTGGVEGAAEAQVRIWGDGPLQPVGRMAKHLRERMLAWNLDIAAREIAKTGARAIDSVIWEPAPVAKLHEIRVPVALAYGTLDETNTTGAIEYLGRRIAGAEVRAFDTAHMINLEKEDDFNEWLGTWLDRHFTGERA